RLVEGFRPDVVLSVRIFGVPGIAARLADSSDHAARTLDTYGFILCAVKSPDRNLRQLCSLSRIACAAERDCGSEHLRVRLDQRPRAKSAQRLSGDIKPARIDMKSLLQVANDFKRKQ